MALSPKAEAFCRAYVGEAQGNASAAAKLAGYSEKTAYSSGPRLLKRAEVLGRINTLRDEVQRKTGRLTLDEWHDLVGNLARNGARDADRAKAMEMAGKAFGVYSERREHSGAIGIDATVDATVDVRPNEDEMCQMLVIQDDFGLLEDLLAKERQRMADAGTLPKELLPLLARPHAELINEATRRGIHTDNSWSKPRLATALLAAARGSK